MLDINPATMRNWIEREEVDSDVRRGVTSADAAEIKALRGENAELRRANEILKTASAFSHRRNSTARSWPPTNAPTCSTKSPTTPPPAPTQPHNGSAATWPTCRPELDKAEQAVERYLLAFEAGPLPETQWGQRIRTLGSKIANLRDREAELQESLRNADLKPPTLQQLTDTTATNCEPPSRRPPTASGRRCYKPWSTKYASRPATTSSPCSACLHRQPGRGSPPGRSVLPTGFEPAPPA